MKIFLYENVGPQPIQKIVRLGSLTGRPEQLITRLQSQSLSGDEFLGLLEAAEAAMDAQDKQEVIQANQMALRFSL